MSKKVFVSRLLPPEAMAALKDAAARGEIQLDVWPEDMPPSRAVMLQKVRNCDGVISLLTDRVDGPLLDAAGPQLKVVSNFAVGYNNIDTAAAKQRGIRVGHTPGVLDDAVADITVALLLAVARRVPESFDFAKQGKWRTWMPMGHVGLDLKGKTLGICGMGRIAFAVAERIVRGWNMKLIYFDPHAANAAAEKQLGARRVDFDTLLAEADIVSLHCALTPQTTKLFGKKEFAKMKKTAIFLNTARGPMHDQQALIEACHDGVIFGAGIDVTDPEPAKADDPVLHLPNLVVTPHIASATIGTRNAMGMIAVRNCLNALAGKPLQHEVPETRVAAKL